MKNKYKGKCKGCGREVLPYGGTVEKVGRVWVVWCVGCYDKSDHSSQEDRECGDRAYEDSCAAAVVIIGFILIMGVYVLL